MPDLFCPDCGAPIRPDTETCPQCGLRSPQPVTASSGERTPGLARRVVGGIVSAFFVILAVLGALWIFGGTLCSMCR